ncbi:hypothetical protein [Pediococcus pentosaceus]|uniref:hypothetical protein n=1 Tax=Pediococcus pentosaceus TaxID=1255 RepID=UPI000C087BB6|nr:hypothetical protein [Pediococcus pentosaceus]QYY85491.1 hypothetical protein GRI00_02525 [Pediococcus pentosaceus]
MKKYWPEITAILCLSIIVFYVLYFSINTYKSITTLVGYGVSVPTIIITLYKQFFSSLDEQILLDKIKNVDIYTDRSHHINIQNKISKLRMQLMSWSYLTVFVICINILKQINYSPSLLNNFWVLAILTPSAFLISLLTEQLAKYRFHQYETNTFLR